jgi:hypothetical protein
MTNFYSGEIDMTSIPTLCSLRPEKVKGVWKRLERLLEHEEWWLLFQDFEKECRALLQHIDGPLEFKLSTQNNFFFPSHRVHMVDLSSAEAERSYFPFPPLLMLELLEKSCEPSAISELRERSNHWMEEFSSKWNALGYCSFDVGLENWKSLGVEWWQFVNGQDFPDNMSYRDFYNYLGLLPRAAKGEWIPPKDLERFPELKAPKNAVDLLESNGGETVVAQHRKKLRKLRDQKRGIQVARTLCFHCFNYFDRRLTGGSVAVCPEQECRKAKRRSSKKRRAYEALP